MMKNEVKIIKKYFIQYRLMHNRNSGTNVHLDFTEQV